MITPVVAHTYTVYNNDIFENVVKSDIKDGEKKKNIMSSQTKILSETRIHIHMLTLTTNNIDLHSKLR